MGVRAQLANLISRHGIKLLPPQIERNSTREQQLLIFKRKVPARCFTKLLPPQIERNNKRTAIFNFNKNTISFMFYPLQNLYQTSATSNQEKINKRTATSNILYKRKKKYLNALFTFCQIRPTFSPFRTRRRPTHEERLAMRD